MNYAEVQLLFEKAHSGELPADFDDWSRQDQNGNTVAHVAAAQGHLPNGFSGWAAMNRIGMTVAHRAAYSSTLPDDFKAWGIVDRDGVNVAQIAARRNGLPHDFQQWDLEGAFYMEGVGGRCTVAHEAAQSNALPADFKDWHLTDSFGMTVAHVAAGACQHLRFDELYPHFDQWDLLDKQRDVTVAHDAAMFGALPRSYSNWSLANAGGWTVAHAAAASGSLPDDFTDWALADSLNWTVAHELFALGHGTDKFEFGADVWSMKGGFNGVTVAHLAAEHGVLPDDFTDWGLTDDLGRTVADRAWQAYSQRALIPAEFRPKAQACAGLGM